jgi:ribosomal protein S18 acetylase RimI-like enzyme
MTNGRDRLMPRSRQEVLPCPPELRAEALGILYRRIPEALRPRLIADVLEEDRDGEIHLSGLWIARRNGRLTGTMLSQPLAGRAAAVWAPEVLGTWGRSATAVALVRGILADLTARGYQIAQALLDESVTKQAGTDLVRGGIPWVTDLVYLERTTATLPPVPPGLPPIDWQSFGPVTDRLFRSILHATYIESLDMPELEGIRSLDDIVAGHRASGRFVAERWQAGRVRGEPEAGAVLLLSEIPDRDAWEVAYLGLTPAARGRGLGRAVLAHALDMARMHVTRLELAVDLRNRPANRLYRAVGMTPFDRRAVHLARLC